MKGIKYISLLLLMAVTVGLTSCLDEGEETFALQKGDFDQLIHSSWKVVKSRLYDPETEVYHSDLFNDSRLDYIYVLGTSQDSEIIDPEGLGTNLSWSADEEMQSLRLQSDNFTIESLGKEIMVISHYTTVNGDDYIQKYYLRNIGNPGDGDDDGDDGDDDATYVVSTDDYGYFKRNGYGFRIPAGAVPMGDNGKPGTVAFSAQGVPVGDLPSSAPAGVEFIPGSGILANPTNFIFTSPIVMEVPLRGHSVGEVTLYYWNALQRAWVAIPFSSVNSNGTVNVSVIELGYFVLGVNTSSLSLGGVKISKSNLDRQYYYYLTLTSENGNGSTTISFASDGKDLYMVNVPLGKYVARVTRERRNSLESGASSVQTSSVNIPVNVNTTLKYSGSSFNKISGWTEIDLSSVNWQTGRPDSWGDATVTYGTGVFQATLNWINYAGSTTDYDLHLTTPEGHEVYYSNKRADGFELDRDVIEVLGNCTENIYSIAEYLPSGTYKVRVHHYGGATGRTYSCRVILQGRVVTTFTGITNTGYQDIYTFTLQ